MQKLINIVALLSGLTSLAVIGGGAYVYVNMDTWRAEAQERLTEVITEGITGALPGLLDGAMPELPKATGDAIPAAPMPSTTGPAIPF